jgi:hypothetical protein
MIHPLQISILTRELELTRDRRAKAQRWEWERTRRDGREARDAREVRAG